MTIHHATVKRAEDNGFVVTETEGTFALDSQSPQFHLETAHMPVKGLVDVGVRLKGLLVEYPGIAADFDVTEETLAFFPAGYRDSSVDPVQVATYALEDFDQEAVADVLEAFEEAGFDPEEGPEEDAEEDTPSVVVPHRYKVLYAERGNRNHCGDWLARWMDGRFTGAEGQFLEGRFTDFLEANGVALTGKWAILPVSGQKGWVGRYRMGGRQKLERCLVANGVLIWEGQTIDIPMDVYDALCERHPNVMPVDLGGE